MKDFDPQQGVEIFKWKGPDRFKKEVLVKAPNLQIFMMTLKFDKGVF